MAPVAVKVKVSEREWSECARVCLERGASRYDGKGKDDGQHMTSPEMLAYSQPLQTFSFFFFSLCVCVFNPCASFFLSVLFFLRLFLSL